MSTSPDFISLPHFPEQINKLCFNLSAFSGGLSGLLVSTVWTGRPKEGLDVWRLTGMSVRLWPISQLFSDDTTLTCIPAFNC